MWPVPAVWGRCSGLRHLQTEARGLPSGRPTRALWAASRSCLPGADAASLPLRAARPEPRPSQASGRACGCVPALPARALVTLIHLGF